MQRVFPRRPWECGILDNGNKWAGWEKNMSLCAWSTQFRRNAPVATAPPMFHRDLLNRGSHGTTQSRAHSEKSAGRSGRKGTLPETPFLPHRLPSRLVRNLFPAHAPRDTRQGQGGMPRRLPNPPALAVDSSADPISRFPHFAQLNSVTRGRSRASDSRSSAGWERSPAERWMVHRTTAPVSRRTDRAT